MAIGLWIMAGSKKVFGSHVRPKGLPKCTPEPMISLIYYQKRHAIVLDYQIKKNGGPPPLHQARSHPENNG